jgi:hypothetical protein
MAVTMKKAIFWDVMPSGVLQYIVFLRSMLWFLVNDNVVPSSLILVTLMM